jgi:2-amino-4-hydroxy-6-hydroxymethyldihydropteridine diphosphokinase
LNAPMLLQELQRIEQQAGRERPYRHAPRTLDLDLLLYGEASINSAQLQVPHPRMFERAFVLVPLAEIAPQKISSTQLKVVDTQAVTRI